MSDHGDPGAQGGTRPASVFADWLYMALKLVVAVVLFAMAALTFVDVVGRYLFSAPVPGTFESVGLLMGVVTFAALPLVTRAQNHITVDLFDSFIRGSFRKFQQFVVLLGSAAMIGFMAERLWAVAIDEHKADYVTEYFGISRAPLLIGLSVLCMITCVILIFMIWLYLTGRLESRQSDTEQVVHELKPEDKPTH